MYPNKIYSTKHRFLWERWRDLADELLSALVSDVPDHVFVSVPSRLQKMKYQIHDWDHLLTPLFNEMLNEANFQGKWEDVEYYWGILIEVCLKRADILKYLKPSEITYGPLHVSFDAAKYFSKSEEDLF